MISVHLLRNNLHVNRALFDHLFQFMFVANEEANRVDLDNLSPLIHVHVPRHLEWPNDPGEISSIINSTKCIDSFFHSSFHLVFFGDITMNSYALMVLG